MPLQRSYNDAVPVELLDDNSAQESVGSQSQEDSKVRDYVISWRNKLRQERIEKVNIWNECWALYRGQEDFSNKEDWQSKIVLPKAWGTVKQATSVIKRFLNLAKKPWRAEPENPSDMLWQLRAEKTTDLTRVFLDKAKFTEELLVGLETGFIMGLGVWKMGWNMKPRTQMRVVTQLVPVGGNPTQVAPFGAPAEEGEPIPGLIQEQAPPTLSPMPVGQGRQDLAQDQSRLYPNQLPFSNLLPPGSLNSGPMGPSAPGPIMVPQKQVVKEEILEGNLTINAVDPYYFYWLPGSKLNKWTGTIEEIEVPKWQLMEMAELGAFSPDLIKDIGSMQIPENQKQSYLRSGEMPRGAQGPTNDTGTVKLTEFYGPLVLDGKIIKKNAHIIIANDTYILKNGENDKWFQTPPYCAFSPLMLPFRTEGVGLVEMVRYIDRALNQIINLGVDTLVFRLMPLFEYTPDIYENPEVIRNGLTPGKLLSRNQIASNGDIGIRPIEMQDVSPGAASMAGILDRAHQEGGLVSELQQSLPRWSGAQTATETEAIQNNQDSFFGSLAADIEQHAIAPIIKMAIDLIMQFIDTANDPRVAAILGIDQQVLSGMNQAEIYEMISGNYNVKVTGLTDQLDKAEMLQNLVQLMNIIGQNPDAWLPYINQDALLRRILESFRPNIHDIEEIISDPQTVAINKQVMAEQKQQELMAQVMPQMQKMQQDMAKFQAQLQFDQESKMIDAQQKAVDQAIEKEKVDVMKTKSKEN